MLVKHVGFSRFDVLDMDRSERQHHMRLLNEAFKHEADEYKRLMKDMK